MKILICGISGSGKTTLAEELNKQLNFVRINGDTVRSFYNDWDLSIKGIYRQNERIMELTKAVGDYLIDIIAPIEELRSLIQPDFIIWMNTTNSSQYPESDKIFEQPLNADIVINSFDYDINHIVNLIKGKQ